MVILLVYLWFSDAYSKSGQGWSCDCFHHWKTLLLQAIPSCLSVCLEWWWYELLIIFSGLLTNAADSVAASGIIIQATAFAYNFPYALNLAVSTRVGNELGANQPRKAKTSSFIAFLCAIFTGVVAMLFMVCTRNTWGCMFTEDEAIVSLLSSTLPIVGLCELGNCPQTTICGVLRGSARPSYAAMINLLSFYAVGLPVSLIMGFVLRMGFLGLWLGLLAAQVVCAVVMIIVLFRTDWELQAKKARELTSNEGNKENLSLLLVN
ncbi:hypothetical protein L6164_001087 [Bauhinia variegata]|uniref:Uncharacterized protein n=1 Tax=Bauhinia variegata TaxID=167791 RepID=A0ACB9Q7T6_BAUVA|nr:hypothetical protein L6164_001087 [Bauhinia variegata]